MRRRGLIRWLLLAGAVCLGLWWTAPSIRRPRQTSLVGSLFDGIQVVRIQIEIPPDGMEMLERSGFDDGQARPAVAAVVRESGTVWTNVSLHLKGWFGSFRPVDQNPALTLKFEGAEQERSFHGLRRISLNNSVQDPSFLSERICRELFAAADVPVPKAAHALVTLNGRDLGLYVLTEGFNKQFLGRYFQHTEGNLYESHGNKDVLEKLLINSGDNRDDHRDLEALRAALAEPNPAQRFARLQRALDMDRFISFLAMEVMTCHWDGYGMNKNNYRVFDDVGSHRIVFIPTGMDQMFGAGGSGPTAPILPPMEGAVAIAVLDAPEGQRRYRQRFAQLYTNVFQIDALLARVDSLAAVIQPAMAESSRITALRNKYEVKQLKGRIMARNESLKRQLSAP